MGELTPYGNKGIVDDFGKIDTVPWDVGAPVSLDALQQMRAVLHPSARGYSHSQISGEHFLPFTPGLGGVENMPGRISTVRIGTRYDRHGPFGPNGERREPLESIRVHALDPRIAPGKVWMKSVAFEYAKHGSPEAYPYATTTGLFAPFLYDQHTTHKHQLMGLVSDEIPSELHILYRYNFENQGEPEMIVGLPPKAIYSAAYEMMQGGIFLTKAAKPKYDKNRNVIMDSIGDVNVVEITAALRLYGELQRRNGDPTGFTKQERDLLYQIPTHAGEIANPYLRIIMLMLDKVDGEQLEALASNPAVKQTVINNWASARVAQLIQMGKYGSWRIGAVVGAVDMADPHHGMRHVSQAFGGNDSFVHGSLYMHTYPQQSQGILPAMRIEGEINSPEGPIPIEGSSFVPKIWGNRHSLWKRWKEVEEEFMGSEYVPGPSKMHGIAAEPTLVIPTLMPGDPRRYPMVITDVSNSTGLIAEAIHKIDPSSYRLDIQNPDNNITLEDIVAGKFRGSARGTPAERISSVIRCYSVVEDLPNGDFGVVGTLVPGEKWALYHSKPNKDEDVVIKRLLGKVNILTEVQEAGKWLGRLILRRPAAEITLDHHDAHFPSEKDGLSFAYGLWTDIILGHLHQADPDLVGVSEGVPKAELTVPAPDHGVNLEDENGVF